MPVIIFLNFLTKKFLGFLKILKVRDGGGGGNPFFENILLATRFYEICKALIIYLIRLLKNLTKTRSIQIL